MGNCRDIEPCSFWRSFFIFISIVFFVDIGTLDGVSSNLFGNYFSATFASASSHRQVKDTAVSKSPVLILLFGGDAQPRGPSSYV